MLSLCSSVASQREGGSSIRPYMAEEDISGVSDWGAAAAAVDSLTL